MIEIKIPAAASPSAPVAVAAPTPEIHMNTQALVKANTGRLSADSMPSNWDIVPTDGGIFAKNNVTAREFSGSMAEFNEALRSY